jgi:hypothetical protein
MAKVIVQNTQPAPTHISYFLQPDLFASPTAPPYAFFNCQNALPLQIAIPLIAHQSRVYWGILPNTTKLNPPTWLVHKIVKGIDLLPAARLSFEARDLSSTGEVC